MRYFRTIARSTARVLRDSASIWILLFLVVLICYTMTAIFVQMIGRYPVREKPKPAPPVEFKDAYDEKDLHRAMARRTWPALKGYDGHESTERTHPNDTLLLYRLDMSQRTIRTPLIKLKKDGRVQDRHPWKFERIIHQTWKTDEIPGQTAPWVKKWLEVNPDWTHMFWTDEAAKTFIQHYYPSLVMVYDSWTVPVQRSDMFRLLVLYTFGGVYADLDMEPLKPLDEIRDWSSCILSREPDLQTYVMVNDLNSWANNYTFTCNAFMACRSHHPFLYYLIGRLPARSPLFTNHPCHLSNTIMCTGPVFVSLGYGYYLRSVTEDVRLLRQETDVICPKYEYFLPTFDSSRLDLLKKKCEKVMQLNTKQKELCNLWKEREYKNEPLNYSYTNHHWFHSYHFNVSQTHVNIDSVTKTLRWSVLRQDEDFEVTYTGP